MSKIEDYLKSMGDTADDIAQFLRIEGIKGAKNDPCFCPIIKAIYHKFPNMSKGLKVDVYYDSSGYRNLGCYGSVYVDSRTYVAITWNDCQTQDPTCPAAIQDFVFKFDAGKYPDLVGESKSEMARKAKAKLTVEELMALKI